MRSLLLLACSLSLACATAGPPEHPRPAAPAADAAPGWTAPAEAQAGCVARSVRLPWKMWARGSVVVKLAVKADGSVGSIEVVGEQAPPEVAEAVEAAVRSCTFAAGKDPAGKAVATNLTLPLAFEDEIPVFDEAPPATPPRQASPNCVGRRLHLGMLSRGTKKVLVAFRVSEKGEPGAFVFKPEELEASLRVKIADAVSSCVWIPGEDAQGRPVAAMTAVALRF